MGEKKEKNHAFPIRASEQQGGIVSSRFLVSLWQFALEQWRLIVGQLGIDFGDGLSVLLDLLCGWQVGCSHRCVVS